MLGRSRGLAPLFLVVGSLGFGCASTAPPPPPLAAPVARITAPPEPLAVAADAPPVDEAVPEPKDLGIWLRVASPARDLPVLGLVLPIPPTMRPILQRPELISQRLFGAALGGHVDLEQPVDFAVQVTPASLKTGAVPGVAFAFVLKSDPLDPAALGPDVRLIPRKTGGRIRVEPTSAGSAGQIGDDLPCELWPAWRGASARIVCANSEDLFDAYGAYLARSVALLAPGATLQVHVPASFFKTANASTSKPRASVSSLDAYAAGERLGQSWINGYLDDLSAIDAEISIGQARVDLVIEQIFEKATSLATIIERARPEAPQPVPAAFWRLPADADAAFSFQGAPPEVVKPLGRAMLQELITSVPDEDVTDAERQELIAALSALFLTGGPLLAAYGNDRAFAKKAVDGFLSTTKAPSDVEKPNPAAQKALINARRRLQGWSLFHLDESPKLWLDGLRELRRVMVKKQEPVAAKPGKPGASPPPAKKKKTELRELLTMSEIALKPSDGLPSGSLHLVYGVAPNSKFKPSAGDVRAPVIEHQVHLFMAPDGDSVWLAVAEDEAIARARLRAQVSGGAPRTLADRADLADLRSHSGAGAGFFTQGGVTSMVLPDASRAHLERAQAQLSMLEGLMHQGGAPITVLWTTLAEAGPQGAKPSRYRVRASVGLEARALTDVLQALGSLLRGTP